MQFRLRLILLESRVVFIASWRWLNERLSRRVFNVFLNFIRWLLVGYISLFFIGFYSFGWFL
ncbi:hypothetical protein DBY65_012250 [Pseudomonas sp. RIT412]|nr:hypothetical protein DBP26_002815 [Pseudomonas sp. RIT 409]RAU54272.1 hypothetical protein DBY65_012250 [Pseudomonas sp. RIT 412]